MGRYVCKTCLIDKDESEFGIKQTIKLKSGIKTYRKCHCLSCYRKIAKQQKQDRYPHAWIRNRYNVDDSTARYWFQKSMEYCEICGKEWEDGQERLCIDHDHTTQEIRGILCKNCNHLLGHAYDKTEILESALVYLRRTGGL